MALRRKAELVIENDEIVVKPSTPTPNSAPVAPTIGAVAAQAPAQEPIAATPPEPTVEKAVVVPQPRVAAPSRKDSRIDGRVFDDKQNLFLVEFGMLPRLRASNGTIFDDKDHNLGDWVDIKIESWNNLYVVGPCDNNAPKELVRYTLNREIFDDGSMDSVAEYVRELRAAGHKKAAVVERMEIVGLLLASAKPSDLVGKPILLSLSPTSAKAFRSFQLTTTFLISSGATNLDDVLASTRFSVEVVNADGNTWSKLVPSLI